MRYDLEMLKANLSKALKAGQKQYYEGFTIEEMANLLSIKERKYKAWRCGETFPDTPMDLLDLSKLFRCSVDYLLTGEENESGDDYIMQQIGLSKESISILKKRMPNQDVLNERKTLFEERKSKLLELRKTLYDDIPKKDRVKDESPDEIDRRIDDELMELQIGLKPGLTDEQLADIIGNIYPQRYLKENLKEMEKKQVCGHDVTVIPTHGFIRKGLLPKVKEIYQEYCELDSRCMELEKRIKKEDPFLDTIDRIIQSEKLVNDISRYLNPPILRTFRIDDGEPVKTVDGKTIGERMDFVDEENVHGKYYPETGAVWLEILDGQSHIVRINKDFVIDAEFIRKLLLEDIHDDLDKMSNQ